MSAELAIYDLKQMLERSLRVSPVKDLLNSLEDSVEQGDYTEIIFCFNNTRIITVNVEDMGCISCKTYDPSIIRIEQDGRLFLIPFAKLDYVRLE